MKALVIGLGSIGMRHARNLRLLGVAHITGMDPDEDRRHRFAAELDGETFSELAGALEEAPDLAVIASPNRYHIEQARRCADAGCHLLIEKPLGIAADGVDALIATVRDRGLFAHVGSNWKFHPAFTTMKRLLDDGAIGRVTGAQVLAGQWLPDWHPDEDYRTGYSARSDLGGGIVFDSHEFDCLNWLLGPALEIRGMTARSGALEIDTEDVAAACIRFESGALATLQIDYIQRDYRRRYHISGDNGTVEWDMRDGQVSHFRADSGETVTVDTPLDDLNQMYVDQMRHVLDGAAGNTAPVTPLEAAARVMDLQLALRDAHG